MRRWRVGLRYDRLGQGSPEYGANAAFLATDSLAPQRTTAMLDWTPAACLGRTGFYLLFACAVTVSVQLVGVYLVFATLIIPPLATRRMRRFRSFASWGVAMAGYACGLGLSVALDLPTGPIIVWSLAALGLAWFAATARKDSRPPVHHAA
jgi:hypothetical protein